MAEIKMNHCLHHNMVLNNGYTRFKCIRCSHVGQLVSDKKWGDVAVSEQLLLQMLLLLIVTRSTKKMTLFGQNRDISMAERTTRVDKRN